MTNPFLEMAMRLAALEKRVAGMVRHGPVAEVNAAEGWVRLDFGKGDNGPLLSPKIPYAQTAGALKVHSPPSVGQNMTMLSPTGDPRQAVAMPMTWSGENASPGDSANPALTFGDVRIDLVSGGMTITIGGMTLSITGSGLSISGGDIETDQEVRGAIDVIGGGISLKSHVHGGVEPGPAATGAPQ